METVFVALCLPPNYLTGSPVEVWVVLDQPGVPEDQGMHLRVIQVETEGFHMSIREAHPDGRGLVSNSGKKPAVKSSGKERCMQRLTRGA